MGKNGVNVRGKGGRYRDLTVVLMGQYYWSMTRLKKKNPYILARRASYQLACLEDKEKFKYLPCFFLD